MKNYFLSKFLQFNLKEYIFIFLTATLFLTIACTNSFSEENVFTINNVKVKGPIDVNFSRDKYINRAFINSFELLMNKILLTRDLEKVKQIKLKEIKSLINSFQFLDESYRSNLYRADIKISYDEKKIKNFLGKKNISFTLPEKISAVFFPVLFINDEFKSFNENYFYKNLLNVEVENELINFILPLEDAEDILKIVKMKDNIELLDFNSLVNKYDEKNYIFVLMNYQNNKLNIHLKTNFNDNKVSKNISHKIIDIKNEAELQIILLDLKLKIMDLWKEQNLINILLPLSVELKFKHLNLKDLDKIRNVFYKINILDDYKLEKFNINNSVFKLYYYSNPKKLKSELLKFGYNLENNQGVWQIYLNE